MIVEHFFAVNCRKSQKIVIITSTPETNVMIFETFFDEKMAIFT
jgi:hypothetical protein